MIEDFDKSLNDIDLFLRDLRYIMRIHNIKSITAINKNFEISENNGIFKTINTHIKTKEKGEVL